MTLFQNIESQEIQRCIENPMFTLQMNPMPTPRPRTTIMWRSFKDTIGLKFTITEVFIKRLKGMAFVNVYSPPEYEKYKKNLMILIRGHRPRIVPGDYNTLIVTFHIPFPKSTLKRDLIDGAPHRKKPDGDNLLKGLQDALEESHVLINDGCLSTVHLSKRYTTQRLGRIEFSLLK